MEGPELGVKAACTAGTWINAPLVRSDAPDKDSVLVGGLKLWVPIANCLRGKACSRGLFDSIGFFLVFS